MGVECSKGHGGDVSTYQGDIGEAGPSTPQHVAGGIAKGTGSKFIKRIVAQAALVQQASSFVERQRELAAWKEPIQIKHLSLNLLTSQDGIVVGGSGVAKGKQQEKSQEVVESKEDASNEEGISNSNDNMLLCQKHAASPAWVALPKQQRMIASKEGEDGQEDMEMREKTPLATVAEVEPAASGGEVEEEAMEVEANKESNKEPVVQQWGIWTSMPLQQVGNDKLEWLSENLALPTPLMLAMLLRSYGKRAAEMEQRFQRELEREKNGVGKKDWEEGEMGDVASNNANLNAY
ncbi:hypothetical protein E4T56_gene9885 [Termitomyces sp. T112]|nr:hypothetical protein E4T56_gene9885 [Termitomyces sp. T112]